MSQLADPALQHVLGGQDPQSHLRQVPPSRLGLEIQPLLLLGPCKIMVVLLLSLRSTKQLGILNKKTKQSDITL